MLKSIFKFAAYPIQILIGIANFVAIVKNYNKSKCSEKYLKLINHHNSLILKINYTYNPENYSLKWKFIRNFH